MNISLFYAIKREFNVNDNGESFCSRRAIARMSGKHLRTIRDLLRNIAEGKLPHEMFESFDGVGFDSEELIPDTLASLIIQYYAFKGSKTAQQYSSAFIAMGLRTLIQKTLGWEQTNKDYTFLLLKEPREWTKIFDNDYYDQLSRLTGLSWDKKTHKKPLLFAQLTYDLVYAYLPKYIYDTIKKTQKQHGGNIYKMHQFLSKEALDSLGRHLSYVLNILSSETSLDNAKVLINNYVTGNYQHRLFG